MPQGVLYYVVGASGAGKDSVIRYARESLAHAPDVLFAHRYITRPLRPDGENHVELTTAEFLVRKRHGLFSMDWESYGFHYGIGVEIDTWLGRGLAVVVNGSRSYIPVARQRYGAMKVVWITAGPDVLAARLSGRGRESRAEIAARLTRNAKLGTRPPAGELQIDNDGALERAGSRLVALLSGEAR